MRRSLFISLSRLVYFWCNESKGWLFLDTLSMLLCLYAPYHWEIKLQASHVSQAAFWKGKHLCCKAWGITGRGQSITHTQDCHPSLCCHAGIFLLTQDLHTRYLCQISAAQCILLSTKNKRHVIAEQCTLIQTHQNPHPKDWLKCFIIFTLVH